MSDKNQELSANIKSALKQLKDPETGRPLSDKQINTIDVTPDVPEIIVGLTSFSSPLRADFENEVRQQLAALFDNENEYLLEIANHDRPAQPKGQVGLTAKAVVAVGSGKGGVGKSTSAVCLALALKRAGAKVGLLDADVYGPSLPHLTGTRGQVTKVDDKIQPLDFDGIPVMSIGFMVPPDQAVVWRGPMLHSAVTTFVRDTAWGDLDYLIIDMPPGTGDIALSLSQLLPLSGCVVVCTPQEVALIDAIKAVAMMEKVKIPVIGLIENMSSFICPDNGKRYDIFGSGGAKEYAGQAGIPFLGEIPININMRQRGDDGKMEANFEDAEVAPFLERIAYEFCRNLSNKLAENPTASAGLPVLK